jgi:hypothetical protein
MFEQASKQKFRFRTDKGMVTVEDLWDMPLTSNTKSSLDTIAKDLNKQLKESEEESFVVTRTNKNKTLDAKFEIVKHIIKVKLDEIQKNEEKEVKASKKEKLLNLIYEKENEELKSKSLDELKLMINDL